MDKVVYESAGQKVVEVTKDDVESITVKDSGYVKVVTEREGGSEKSFYISPARVWHVEEGQNLDIPLTW